MVGKATAPARAAGAVVRKVRRLHPRVCFIEVCSRVSVETRMMTAAILSQPAGRHQSVRSGPGVRSRRLYSRFRPGRSMRVMPTRRELLKSSSLALFGSLLAGAGPAGGALRRLSRPGGPPRGAGQAAPAEARRHRRPRAPVVRAVGPGVDRHPARDSLKALGLNGKLGKHVYDRRGYFAGRDEDRAADLNAMFADPGGGRHPLHPRRLGRGPAAAAPRLGGDREAPEDPRRATATSRRCCWRSSRRRGWSRSTARSARRRGTRSTSTG